jgi:hypothetical protein
MYLVYLDTKNREIVEWTEFANGRYFHPVAIFAGHSIMVEAGWNLKVFQAAIM